jgi:radical SAM superfamily enzyme YgiQ (UPF0313 family)
MPITLAYVSSILKLVGHEVLVIDDIAMQLLGNPTDLSKILDNFQPELAIINTAIPTVFKEDTDAARKIKDADPSTLTVMIGMAPTLLPEAVLKTGQIDIAVRREPELTIKRLCDAGEEWRHVEGITFRDNGKVVSNPDAGLLKNLDELPMPDFISLPLDAYRTPVDRARQVIIDVSRGCPHGCIYCVGTKFYGKEFRCRSPQNVIEEMEYVRKLGVKKILFWADTFTFDRSFVNALCREILERGLEQEISWVANSRVDGVDPDTIDAMREAGCFLVAFGVESGVQEILDYVRKGITLKQTRDAFRWMREAGLPSAAHVVFGLAPFENGKTVRKTLDFVKEIAPNYANFHVATPYPKTELYHRYREAGYITSEDFSEYESSRANITLPELSSGQLEYWRDRAFREFYVTPRMILQEISRVGSLAEVKNLFDDAYWFISGWMKVRAGAAG